MNTATEDRPKIHMDYLESKVDDPKVLEENPSANAKSGDSLLQWTTVDYI